MNNATLDNKKRFDIYISLNYMSFKSLIGGNFMYEKVELELDNLLLDESNPRIGNASNQSNALEKIINRDVKQFKNLLASIGDVGIDPGDNFYVIKSDSSDEYIVLEGNRRLSALKVLNNPRILESIELEETQKNAIDEIVSNSQSDSITLVECTVFESRNAANSWIILRHGGEKGGEGRVRWGLIELQQFNGDFTLIDILNFMEENTTLEQDRWLKIRKDIEQNKSSTLDRLMSSDTGKAHLGVTILEAEGQKIPQLDRDPKWVISVLEKVLTDIHDNKINTRIINKSSDLDEYFNNLPKILQSTSRKIKSKAFRDIKLAKKPSIKSISIPTSTITNVPRVQQTLAPKKLSFSSPESEKGKKILREASSINLNKHAISAAFLLRAFIELALVDYMKVNKLLNSNNINRPKLKKRVEMVIDDIIKNNVEKKNDFNAIKRELNKEHSTISIDSLNDFVHNKYSIPSAEDLRNGWVACTPLFEAIYPLPE